MTQKAQPFDVRFQDLVVFLRLLKEGSITATARALKVTPSQVSKAIARLEKQLDTRLIAKSGRGIMLSKQALQLVPQLSTAVAALERARRGNLEKREVGVAGVSHILSLALPALANHLPALRLRGLQLTPSSMRAAMGLGHFEWALYTGATELPSSWLPQPVGDVGLALFTSPKCAAALGRPSLAALKAIPFVTPVAFNEGHWAPSADGCPLAHGQRITGHEASTLTLAMDIAAHTHQLVFGPRYAARDNVRAGRLVDITPAEWNVSNTLFLAVDIDRVTTREMDAVRACLAKVFVDPP